MAVSHVKSNPVANMTGTVTVFNSAGVTTTVAATDLVRPTDWNSAHNQFMTIGGNTAGVSTLSGTNIEFHASGAATLSGNGQTIVFSAPTQSVQTQGSVQVQGSTGAISFGNGNGITFGGNASIITASHNALTTARASTDAIGLNSGLTANGVSMTANSSGLSLNFPAFLTTAAQSDHSHGNPTLALTNLSGTTASNSAGLTLSLSAAAPGGGGGPAISAAGASASNGTIVFSNSNGVSFGMNGSTITATVEPGAAAGIAAVGAGTQQATSGTVTFVNSNGLTFGMSGSSQITASHNGITQQSTQPVAVSGQNGSYAFSTLSLSNANGISFGTSAGSAITASHNALTSQSNQAVSGSNGSFTFQTVTFGNLNGLSFYTSNGSLVGSHNALTTAAASDHSHGNPTLALTNLSGTTASNSAGLTLSLSAAAPGGAASVTMYATGNTTQSSTGTQALSSMLVRGEGGVSAGISGGSIVVSGPALTSLSVTGALSASSNGSTISLGVGTVTVSATSNTTQASSGTVNLNALIFQGAGGASVGVSNGSIVISGAAGGGGGGAAISAGANSQSTGTVNFANSNGITFGLSNNGTMTASYNSTQFAGTGTTFAGANISASMTLNSNGLNLSASVAAPGAAAEQNAMNLLGANTAGNTTATGSTIGLSGLNLTLSGTNASQIVISAPATSSLVGASGISLSTNGSTISVYNAAVMNNYRAFEKGNNTTFSSLGQNTLYLQHFIPEDVVQFSNMELWARGSFVSSSNSMAYSQTIRYGIYSNETGASSTRMTLMGSSSMTFGVSFNSNTAMGFTVGDGVTSFTTTSGGTGLITNVSGPFHLYLPFTSTLQPNVKHALAIHVSSTTAVGTQAWRFAPMVQTVMNSLSMGRIFNSGSQAASQTVIGDREMGAYSATTGTLPSTYATTQLTIAVSRQQLPFMLE